MGNALNLRLFAESQAPPQWYPNIPIDGSNNINRPYSSQMQEMVLHFAVPLFLITALAIRESQQVARQRELTLQHEMALQQRETLQRQLNDVIERSRKSQGSDVILRHKLHDNITEIEQEEETKLKEKIKRVDVYNEGLETILDVRCSMFRGKASREELEMAMMDRLQSKDGDLAGMVYPGLQNVINYDHRFCGANRKTNGKLRHLYAQNWRLQLDLEKQKAVLMRLKQATKPGV